MKFIENIMALRAEFEENGLVKQFDSFITTLMTAKPTTIGKFVEENFSFQTTRTLGGTSKPLKRTGGFIDPSPNGKADDVNCDGCGGSTNKTLGTIKTPKTITTAVTAAKSVEIPEPEEEEIDLGNEPTSPEQVKKVQGVVIGEAVGETDDEKAGGNTEGGLDEKSALITAESILKKYPKRKELLETAKSMALSFHPVTSKNYDIAQAIADILNYL